MKLFKNKIFLLFLPAAIFMILPFYGFFHALTQSTGGEGLAHYEEILSSERFLSSVWFSIRTAGIATIISIILGLVFTKLFHPLLNNTFPRLMVWIPMLFPHFVWGYMVILIFSETGWMAQTLVAAGWLGDTSNFPVWTRDPEGIGIIVTYVWKEVPLVILLLFPVYASIRPEFYALVNSLGGNAWHRLTTVDLPHLLPVLVESFLIIFSFTLAAYEVPALIGTTFPEMISVLGYEWFYGSSWEDRPLAFAAMVMTSLFLLILTLIGYFGLSRRRWRAMRGDRA
ncbi:ABC transporter permease subunit [Halobacillus sp. Nhm2S1]|uniref:ABC transporter permease subunit n=1 Tax=Halobacillus sp. Nhm2S1 TaxID=2866716 RepID=UPI001C736786|nr:ABC transporter permease subunit [Halobacillus sp. Nhm2S1]MBX0359668.1 ABC transporter permease subunit [Halobacillus sp. Nhm2S1]